MRRVIVNLPKLFALMLVLFCLTVGQQLASANAPSPLTDKTYSIKPVLPKNQNPEINNYFSITSNKDIKDTYDIEIRNDSSEELTLYVQSMNSFTSSSGLIQYSNSVSYTDSYINDNKFRFTDYVDINDVITVEPNSVSTFSFDVNIPKFDGSVLGALSFRTSIEGEETSNDKVSIQINNEINNIIAFNVDFGNGALNSVEFGETSIYHSDLDTHINLPVSVVSNTLIEDAKIIYKVLNKDGELIFEQPKATQIHLVSNADFDLHLPWLSSTLKKNKDYVVVGSLTANNNGEDVTFGFRKEVRLTPSEGGSILSTISGGVVVDDAKNTKLWIVVGVIIIIVGLAMFMRNRSAHAETDVDFEDEETDGEEVYDEEDSLELTNEDAEKLRFILNASRILNNDLEDIDPEYFDDVIAEVHENLDRVYIKFVSADGLVEIDEETFPMIEDDEDNLVPAEESLNYSALNFTGIYMEGKGGKKVLSYVTAPF